MASMYSSPSIDPGLVRTKAYEIWQSLGCPEGAAEQTWFEAERQLRSDLAEPTPKTAPKPATADVEAPIRATQARTSEPPVVPKQSSISEPPVSSTVDRPKKSSASPRRSTRR